MTKAVFQLRELIETLFMPFSISLLLIALGLIRRCRVPIVAGLAILVIAGLPAVSNSLCSILENQYPHLRPEQCPTADAVVALGGFAGEKKQFPNEIQWYDAVDRFEAAVQLVKLQKAPVLLLPRAKPLTNDWQTDMRDLLDQAAIGHGVPATEIQFTKPAATTAEEAEGVKEYLLKSGGRRVILVTSAMHMWRAAFLFRKAGIEFVPFPVDYQSNAWEWRWENFIPSPASLIGTGTSFKEICGSLFYRFVPFAGPHAPAAK